MVILVLPLVAGLLAACNSPADSQSPGLEFGVVPSTVEVLRGDEAEAVLRVVRSGGLQGEVVIEPASLPTGIHIEPTRIPATADDGALQIAADSNLAPGRRSLNLVATAGDLAREATVTIEVTALPPTVDEVTLKGGDGSAQLRQGSGSATLIMEGNDLDAVHDVALDDLSANLTSADRHRLVVKISVPHGAELGGRTLHLVTSKSTFLYDAVLEITAITAAPSGDDMGGIGTPANPYRTLTRSLSVAAAGDTVRLLDGVYDEAAGEVWPQLVDDAIPPTPLPGPNVPDGVSVVGESTGAILEGSSGGSGLSVALAFARHGAVRSLTFIGFERTLLVYDGTVDVEGAAFRRAATSAVGVFQSGRATVRDSIIQESLMGGVAYGGGRLRLLRSEVRAGIYGVAAGQSAAVEIVESQLVDNWFGIYAVDHAVVDIDESSVSGNSTFGIGAEGFSRLSVRGGEIAGSPVGLAFSARELVLRGVTLHSNATGVRVFERPERIDLGTSLEPGANDLTGNLDYQLEDRRPDGATPAITLSATRLAGTVPEPGLVAGPHDSPPTLLLENATQVRFY